MNVKYALALALDTSPTRTKTASGYVLAVQLLMLAVFAMGTIEPLIAAPSAMVLTLQTNVGNATKIQTTRACKTATVTGRLHTTAGGTKPAARRSLMHVAHVWGGSQI